MKAWLTGMALILCTPLMLVGGFFIGIPLLIGQDFLAWWSRRPRKRQPWDGDGYDKGIGL